MRAIDQDELNTALKELGIQTGEQDTKVQESKTRELGKQERLKTIDNVVEEKIVNQDLDEPHTDLTDFEKEQLANGWNPKGVKSAEEWARNAPLYDKLHKQQQEIKYLSQTLNSLKEHLELKESLGYNKALNELKELKREAIKRGDVDSVEKIEEEQKALKLPQLNPVPAAVLEFRDRNKAWFDGPSLKNKEMTEFTLQRDVELLAYHLSPEEHMKVLEDDVKNKFPSYFSRVIEEPVHGNYAQVEIGNNSGTVNSKSVKQLTFRDLPEDKKEIVRNFQKYGIINSKYTVDDYIKDITKRD